uniref:Uncharacterized protein n=1 Tax=uncultured SAR11 cluster alpha proteobacterium H17925_45G17 TaxID=715038 RepID=E7CA22_9PROT|nr:hypothetical protein [uncultured SAR11 cluster alpha proteobacterium H17925_45G17]
MGIRLCMVSLVTHLKDAKGHLHVVGFELALSEVLSQRLAPV